MAVIVLNKALMPLSDMTDPSKRASNVNHDRTAFVQDILDAMPTCMAVLNPQGELVAVNQAWVRFNAVHRSEGPLLAVAGQNFLENCRVAVDAGDANAARVSEGILDILSGMLPNFSVEYEYNTPWDQRWFTLQATPIAGPSGGAILSLSHISEQKQADARRQAAEAKYRKLVEQLPGITYIAEFGPSGRWHYVSPQIKTLLGFSEELWLADPHFWFQQVCEEDRERVVAAEKKAGEKGERFACEYRMRTNDQRILWFHDEGVLLDALEGVPPMIQGVMLDITERKEAEESLRLRESQLLQSQKVDALGRLAGGIAHDFNNLLTSIMGFSQLILDGLSADSPMREDAEQILGASERGAKLTRQLLALGRKPSGTATIIDLNNVITDMDRVLRRTLGEDIELITEFSEQPAPIHADADLIQQVVMNLALNARDAMPQGGKLILKASVESMNNLLMDVGEYVLLHVQDTGLGMTLEVKKQIFEPFFTTKERGEGSGLGLASVYGIVKQYKGHIDVDSTPHVGTTLKIYLPTARGPTAPRHPTVEAAPPRGNETVLIVEDEETIRHLTSKTLATLGYTVLQASNGVEALALYEKKNMDIHMIVTDVVMPQMSGPMLIKKLQESGHGVPYLFMSGFVDERVASHGIAPTAPNLLKKPFKRLELAKRVRETLDQANTA